MTSHIPKLPKEGELIGGRFRITELLGTGGFGTVYRALQENVGRDVALKFMAPSVAKDPVNIERFRREAFHVSQLRHPNTITLFDYGQTDDGLFYMVMELLEGVSLSDAIQNEGAISEGRAAHIFLQILKSLSEAHQRGLVHRDMKPENIYLCEMFGEQDYVKVLDFGVAKMTMMEGIDDTEEKLTKAGRIFGTPMYMAPEQACAEPITPATDIYALGLLLFEILTGMPPVTGRNRMDVIHKQIREQVPKLTRNLRGTPLGDVILHATRKKPEERYQDASQMWEAFYDAIRNQRIFPAPRGSTRPEISLMTIGVDPRATPNPSPSFEAVPPEVASAPPPLPAPPVLEPTEPPEALLPSMVPEVTDPSLLTSSPDLEHLLASAPPRITQDDDDEKTHIQVSPIELQAEEDVSWVPPTQLPLLGREADIANMVKLVTTSILGRSGHIVLLEGESGVGKTRMVQALREALFAQNIGMCTGTFRRRSSSLEALREALADYWWVSNADRDTVAAVVRADLESLGLPGVSIEFLINFIRPLIAPVLRPSTQEIYTLFAKLERVLLMLAEVPPITIALEDIQNADNATLSFLEYFAITLRTQTTPIVIALTLRSGERTINPDLEQSLRTMSTNIGVGLTRERLRRLRGRDLSVLLDNILPLESRLKERIAWLSQGNPLHAIQIVRYLEAEDSLVETQGRYDLKHGTPRQIDLPPDLMDMMQLRVRQSLQVNANHPGLGRMIMWLAVLGIRVPIDLVMRVITTSERLPSEQITRNLETLRRFGIVHQRKHHEFRCVEFDNSLLREAILRDIAPRPEHPGLHRVAAVEKQAFYNEHDLDIPHLEIAEHWRQAGDDERYRDALFAAAERSMQNYNPRGAREQFRELMRLLEARGELNSMWGEAMMALAELSRRFGELGLAEDNYRAALESGVLQGAELTKAQRGLAHLLFVLGRYPEAVEHYQDAHRVATDIDDIDGIAKALTGLSSVHLRQGDTAQGTAVRAELSTMLKNLPRGTIAGRVLLHLAEAAKRLGQMQQRHDYLKRALENFKASGDQQGLSDTLVDLSGVLMLPAENFPERMAEADRMLHEALEIKRAIGDRQGVADIFRFMGNLEQQRGDIEAAENYLLQSLRMHEALGAVFHIGAVHNSLAIARMSMADLDQAEKHFDEAGRLFDRVGDKLAVSHTLLNKGTLAVNRMQMSKARELLQEARELYEGLGSTWGLYDVYNHLAIVAMWEGRFLEAERLLHQTLAGLSSESADEDKAIARSLMGLLRCFQGRLQLAALELGRSRGDAEDMNMPTIMSLCQANATFYAAVVEDLVVFARLFEEIRDVPRLHTLERRVWLELLEHMTRHISENEPGHHADRLKETVASLFESFGLKARAARLSDL